jgi:hypothetical protein
MTHPAPVRPIGTEFNVTLREVGCAQVVLTWRVTAHWQSRELGQRETLLLLARDGHPVGQSV